MRFFQGIWDATKEEVKMYLGQTVLIQLHEPVVALIIDIIESADPKIKRCLLRVFNRGEDAAKGDWNKVSDYSEEPKTHHWSYTKGDIGRCYGKTTGNKGSGSKT